MTYISRHCCIAINLLALLCLTPCVSLGQSPSKPSPALNERIHADAQVNPNLLLSLPGSDALITIDFKRLVNEVLPRLLADEPTVRPLVISLLDLKTLTSLDPQAVEHIAIGLRYDNSQGGTSTRGFSVVAVVQSSEAARLPATIGSAAYLEQQYAGKKLFIATTAKTAPQLDVTDLPTEGGNDFAIAALNENTIVLGDVAYVRACIDVNAAKVKGISPEQAAALKRNPKALLSAASLLPPSVISAIKEYGNPQLGETLASLKWLYASVELSPNGLEFVLTSTTGSPEQAKNLADILSAFKTLFNSFAGGKTTENKILRELIRGSLISTEGNELQVRGVVTQATLNMLAKRIAVEAYMYRGITQLELLSDPDGAIAQFNKTIMLDPDDALAWYNRGKAYSDKGNLDAAIADYDKAIALEPAWAPPYNNRGFARLRKEEFDAAIIDLDKAIALEPTGAFAYNNRGKAFAGKGDLEKAMVDYDKSIALYPENALAFFNRGHARSQKGEFDGAIADLDRAITLSPQMFEAYNGRGNIRYARYHQTGLDKDLNDAIDDYDKAISLTADDAVLYLNRGYALTAREEFNRAIADFDKSLALDPKLGDAYNARGIARYSKDEFEQAIADYDRAIALTPNSAEFYGNRALARLALHLDQQAAQDLKKCYELDESMREVFEPAAKELKKTRRGKPRRP